MAASTVHAHQNETVDALCYRILGRTADVTEQTLQINPGLADLGPTLPQGTAVTLPAQPKQPDQPLLQLWD